MKRPSCLSALLSLTVAVGVPAISAELDIPGNYGNEAGCRHAATGDFEGDDLLLLTRRDVSTYATLCSFVHIYPAEADSHVAVVTCGHEGEGYTTLGLMRVQKDPDGVDAYHIFGEDGSTWGKAGRCP